MTLGELLQELRENILHDRSNRVSGGQDYLWTDETLVRYINEAHNRLAREGLLIRDHRTPEVTHLELTPGVAEYDLHPSVLFVASAREAVLDVNLIRAGNHMLNGAAEHRYVDPATLVSMPPGRPRYFSTDEGLAEDDLGSISVMTLRVYPAPAEATELRLRVIRNPLEPLGQPTDVPEIPAHMHMDMLDWAAYLALRIVDVDAGLPQRAKEFRQSFELTVQRARRLTLRKLFAPTGFAVGARGFSWEK